MGKCPACGIDDPEIEGPQPDGDGMYQVCTDCGYLADDLEKTGMLQYEAETGA